MTPITKRMDVEQAATDLRSRTLSDIPRSLDRLIYLASMRDYNTGLYYHDGLASRFTQEVACEALANCHREAFNQLVSCSLRDLVGQMEGYIDSTHTSARDFVAAWITPYWARAMERLPGAICSRLTCGRPSRSSSSNRPAICANVTTPKAASAYWPFDGSSPFIGSLAFL